jgi:hypothetical protein
MIFAGMVHFAAGQSSGLYIPLNIQKAYQHNTRSYDGTPGSLYWQNRADYRIAAEFDPVSRLLQGSEEITYYNNSPDTLRKLVLHLFPDFFKKGNARDYNVDFQEESNGLVLEEVLIRKGELDLVTTAGEGERGHSSITFNLSTPVFPRDTLILQFTWHYTVNEKSHIRTGAVDSSSFFVAYFYPRLAVYDDINGWNNFRYTGGIEFYNDFGNFEVYLTVPPGFIVWATGQLQNPEQMFTQKYYRRYRQALSSDSIITIVDSTECTNRDITHRAGMNTWKFRAENVSDFAFALSDHYVWDASSLVVDRQSGRRVFISAAYDKNAADFYKVASIARKGVEYMSGEIPGVPFPYPCITVFNALDEMEYPMMVNLLSYENPHSTLRVTLHEIFHSYFPFYMGFNETLYAWMDEGMTTFGTFLMTESLDSPAEARLSFYEDYRNFRGDFIDIPMFVVSDFLKRPVYLFNSYVKPAAFFLVLKDALGDDLFKKTLREFMRRWHGKHPSPYDLFFTFTNVSGQNLDWLIKPWFFEYGYADLALKEIHINKNQYRITVEKVGRYPIPIDLQISYTDGGNDTVHVSTMVWNSKKTEHIIEKPVSRKISSVQLLNRTFMDADSTNDKLSID